MEKSRSTFAQSAGESVAVFAVLAGVCLVSFLILVSALILPEPFVILVPAPLIYISVKRGYSYGFALLLLMTAVFWLVSGAVAALVFLVLFSPAVFAVSAMLIRKKRMLTSVAVSMAAFAAGAGLLVAYVYFVMQTDVLDLVTGALENYMKASPGVSHQLLYLFNMEDILTGAKDMGAILSMPEALAQQSAVSELKKSLALYMPSLLAEFVVLAGFFNYILPRAVLKKRGVAVAPIPAFSEFRLPKGFFMGMAGVALVMVGAYLADLSGFTAVLDAVVAAYRLVFTIAGLSLIDYLLKRRNVGIGARVAVQIAVTALFYSSLMLPLIGLFESALKLKDRMDKPFDQDGL